MTSQLRSLFLLAVVCWLAALPAKAAERTCHGPDLGKKKAYRATSNDKRDVALFLLLGSETEELTRDFQCKSEAKRLRCEPRERVLLPDYGYPDFQVYELTFEASEAVLVGLSGHSGPQVVAKLPCAKR